MNRFISWLQDNTFRKLSWLYIFLLVTPPYTFFSFYLNFISFMFFRLGAVQEDHVLFMRDLRASMKKQSDLQGECITEMCVILMNHVPVKEIQKILDKYNVRLDDIWKDFNDRNGPRKPKKEKKAELPKWVKETQEKLKEAVQGDALPSPAYRGIE